MLTFKKYITLSESTKDLHKAIGEKETKNLLDTRVDRQVQSMHDKIFGEGNHHIEIPLHNPVPESVHDHIKANGDSVEGDKVKLKSGRHVEIAKYLGRSKAPKHVVDAHDHWDKNKGEFGNTKLVISRHKGEVASCSTGTHWDSCAKATKSSDDNDGPAWRAMPEELRHGTTIAMHVHKDAKPNEHGEYDSKDILGRTLIKRHQSYDGKNSSFHREQRKYGAFPETANDAVDKFTKKHYPIHHADAMHTKHEDLYDDDGNNTKFNPHASDESLHSLLKHRNTYTRMSTLDHPNIASSHIHAALDDESPIIRRMAAKHNNATPENIHKGLKDIDQSVQIGAISNIHANSDHIKEALKSRSPMVRKRAAGHPNASNENLHDAVKHSDHEVALEALKNKNIKKEHFESALNHPNVMVKHQAQKGLDAI